MTKNAKKILYRTIGREMPVAPEKSHRRRSYHKECELPPKDVRFPQTTIIVEAEAVLEQVVVEEDTARREHQGQGKVMATDDVEDDYHHRVSVERITDRIQRARLCTL